MKLYSKLILAGCMTGMLASCNYLDFDESTNKTQEEVFSTFDNVRNAVAGVYTFLPQDFGALGGAMREAATDNASYVWDNNNVYKIYDNKWSPVNTVDDVWANMYTGIQAANSYLESYNEDFLKRFSLNDGYDEEIAKFRMYPNEVRALRAFYFFELAKRYGDVPLVTKTLKLEEVNTLKRSPFQEVIDFIATECSQVAEVLPVDHNSFWKETGRVTKGMALALKSRALLYAASELHNPGHDTELWKKAAEAAKEVMDMGKYSLPNIEKDPLYSKNGSHDVLKSAQMIFERRGYESDSYERTNLPIGFEGGNSGNTPTQNLVDAYEMANGEIFDWNNAKHVKEMYINEEGQPVSRDPRFYKTVTYNGSILMGERVESLEGGKNGLPLVGATETGYYMRKYINETMSLDPAHPITKNHHFILFRYAEILLNYAEAMNEWVGADVIPENFTLSARDALNMVRAAANMPKVTVTGATFTERLRNERRVELAFEDHRFWDIRRWKKGSVVKDIYGVRLSSKGEYQKVKVQTRVWEDKMYLYPVSQQEIYKNPGLGQNIGWN